MCTNVAAVKFFKQGVGLSCPTDHFTFSSLSELEVARLRTNLFEWTIRMNEREEPNWFLSLVRLVRLVHSQARLLQDPLVADSLTVRSLTVWVVKRDRLRDVTTHEIMPIVCCSRTESRTLSLNFSQWETEVNRFLGEKTNGLSEGAIYNSHCPSVAWTYLKDTLHIFINQNSSQPLYHIFHNLPALVVKTSHRAIRFNANRDGILST